MIVHFINGDLSTDYLERFSIIDKMNEGIKNKFNDKTKVLPGLAAALLYSGYGKKNKDNLNFTSNKSSSLSETNSKKYCSNTQK